MAQRKQKTIAAYPGEMSRTEFLEPMRNYGLSTGEGRAFPWDLRDRARTAGDQRRRRAPPGQILRDDAAVLDESASRLRPATCRGSRSFGQDQAAVGSVAHTARSSSPSLTTVALVIARGL